MIKQNMKRQKFERVCWGGTLTGLVLFKFEGAFVITVRVSVILEICSVFFFRYFALYKGLLPKVLRLGPGMNYIFKSISCIIKCFVIIMHLGLFGFFCSFSCCCGMGVFSLCFLISFFVWFLLFVCLVEFFVVIVFCFF